MKPCSKCGNPRDLEGQRYCRACKATDKRERYRRLHPEVKQQSHAKDGPRVCSRCGGKRDKAQRYCHACRLAWAREHRPKHSELPEQARQKANVRSYTKVLQQRGHMSSGGCQECGSLPAENHHLDYNNPRLFMRLCRSCHVRLHQSALAAA